MTDALARPERPRVSVLVPSWRRPDALARCLDALLAQRRPALEIRVACRPDDAATRAVIAHAASLAATHARTQAGPEVVEVLVSRPGTVAALQAALDGARGELTALTDDDAVAPPDWLAALEARIDADPRRAGVGGRDDQPGKPGAEAVVGVVQWFGRVVGNHHLGAGAGRDVDILKGVNALYRTSLLRAVGFDARLLGEGAQVHWEMALARPLRQAGWLLWYDPAVRVAHLIADRADADQTHRGVFSPGAHRDAVHNETLILLEWLGTAGRLAFILWAVLIGTKFVPGLAQLPRVWWTGRFPPLALWRASVLGRWRGWRSWRRTPAPAPARGGIPAPPGG